MAEHQRKRDKERAGPERSENLPLPRSKAYQKVRPQEKVFPQEHPAEKRGRQG